jgi:hypothetical protein
MAIFENMRGAWDVLLGLKRATAVRPDPTGGDRIGSDPSRSDDERNLLNAAYEYYRYYTHLEPDRISVYSDMDEMYQYVLCHAAMEAYIEDALQPDMKTGMSIWPKSANPTVQAELLRLFETLEMEDRAPGDLWGMAKYGDHFGLLKYEKGKGVYDMLPMEPRITHRHEDSNRVLQGFTVGDSGDEASANKTGVPMFKPWDMVHFRVRGRRPTDPYGTPFFIQVRLIYKVLKLMEEQMTIYRMNLHPDRLIFKVFTGSAGPDERRRIVQLWRRDMEKVVSINHGTGRMNSEYAPWMVNQNIYWPIGGQDQVSGVEKFPGSANSGDIFDVEYMRDLFFAGTRVPKAYMGFEDSQGYRGTDTLSAQSLKFARGVKRLQRHDLQGLTRLCRIHLAIRGIDSHQPENHFSLEMTPVSYLDEAHRSELYAKRYEALGYMLDIGDKMAASFGEGKFNSHLWAQYTLSEFGQFDDDTIAKLLSPAMAGQGNAADLTYMPAGSAFRFERMSADEMSRLRDMIGENDELKALLMSAGMQSTDCEFQTTMSCTADRQKIGDLTESEMDTKVFDKAAEHSTEFKLKYDEDAKKRLTQELKEISEAMQAKYGDD